jgi:putative methionine-R-sulfoxide reductase with GAF domain
MPPRPLDALAHALAASTDLDGAVVALADGVADLERTATIALFRHDGTRGLLIERVVAAGPRVERAAMELSLTHLPRPIAFKIAAGAEFVDLAEESGQYLRLFGMREPAGGGVLALKGIRFDGQLVAVLGLLEERRAFGTRAVQRIAPAVALFELALARAVERQARLEAVHTLEQVTQKVHADYVAKLGELEAALGSARATGTVVPTPTTISLEREQAKVGEDLRRAQQQVRALEQQISAATAQLEQTHVELHRRSEVLRQRSRTLYLLERVLSLAAESDDPRALAEGLLSLVGDDLQAQRCSLFLRAPEPNTLYLAAARGLAPHIKEGQRIVIGQGVAGRVAATREPLLVVDAADASAQPLLGDEYLTTGSFISFPLVLHDELIGVVNLTNRVQRGLFVEEDVERVRLLGLVCALAAAEAHLAERLLEGAAL